MAKKFIDLHTHSTASDGSDSPAAIVRKAASSKLSAIALTDHDTLDGLDEAQKEAERLGLAFVRGVELAVKDEFGELHILGLWVPKAAPALENALSRLRRGRAERNQAILDKLCALGMPVAMEEVLAVSGGVAVGRPHIAKVLAAKGYVDSYQEAFDRYIGWKAQAYVPRDVLGPQEGIGLLRETGAHVVLAHPCLKADMTAERLDAVLTAFKEYGITALEAYHSAHGPKETRLCVELAAKHGLLLSGGSDYHGRGKRDVLLGRAGEGVRVPWWVYERLLAAVPQCAASSAPQEKTSADCADAFTAP